MNPNLGSRVLTACAATLPPWSQMHSLSVGASSGGIRVSTSAPAVLTRSAPCTTSKWASFCRCPYYSLAEGGVYGSLANTSDWSTQYWGALAGSALTGPGCPVAQSALPAKFQARPICL